MAEESQNFVVTRIREDLRDRISDLAKKKGATLTSLINLAVERLLEQEEYTFEDFLKVAEEIPSLRLHQELIKKEMKECPPGVCKELIEIIKDKDAFIFEESFENIKKKIDSLEKPNLYGTYLHISIKENHTNQINDILKHMANTFKNSKIRGGAAIRQGKDVEGDKILLFVAYNKKEGENGKT